MHFAIHTGDNPGNLAGPAGTAPSVREDSLGTGQEDHPAAAHRAGKGRSGPGQGKVEDFRSSCGMQNLSCRRGKQTEELVCLCLLHPCPYNSHFRLLSRGPYVKCETQTSKYLVKQRVYF